MIQSGSGTIRFETEGRLTEESNDSENRNRRRACARNGSGGWLAVRIGCHDWAAFQDGRGGIPDPTDSGWRLLSLCAARMCRTLGLRHAPLHLPGARRLRPLLRCPNAITAPALSLPGLFAGWLRMLAAD